MTSIYNPYTSSLYGSTIRPRVFSNPDTLDYNSLSLYDDDYDTSRLSKQYGSNTSKARLARENAILRAKLEEYKDAAENRTGLFGGPVLGADEKGNGGLDIFSGVGGFLLSKLLGGGKDGGGGGLGDIFGNLFG
jgi:hypothetical protein